MILNVILEAKAVLVSNFIQFLDQTGCKCTEETLLVKSIHGARS